MSSVPALHHATARQSLGSRTTEGTQIRRDQVRLLVADGHSVWHRRFADLPDQLAAGDLVVVNTSATLPAAVDGALPDGRRVVVHFATGLDDGTQIEVRQRTPPHPAP